MFRLINRPGTNHIVRFAIQNRLYQFLYILRAVLIVSIRVYNDIRPLPQASVQPRHKALGQPLVLREVYDVVYAPFFCYFNCIILASIIDDQILDLVDAV